MHLRTLLHRTFEKELPEVHKVRLKSLMSVVEVATGTNKLYLTGLGRQMINKNTTKSNIQKVDRLLGNGHLQSERNAYYQVIMKSLLKQGLRPWIHVDWSCINPVTDLYMLRASLSMSGRSIVLYERCYPKSKENNHATHKAFLDELKALLSEWSKPIIVTDAGFRGPWFSYVLALGWDFVGRLRNKNSIKMDDSAQWLLGSTYFSQATGKPTYLGHGLLTKKGQVPTHFVLYRKDRCGRQKLNLNKSESKSGKTQRFKKNYNEPWLLATSLNEAECKPQWISNIYKQRMRIEENFRDTKCPYYGLGLKQSLSQTTDRLNILLLIAAIATFMAWIAGLFTIISGKAASFQAHSAKYKSVLSKVFLGREALQRRLSMTVQQYLNTLQLLFQLALDAQTEDLHVV